MKSLTGKITSVRGWALLLALLLGAGMMISACGDEEVPAPTTPAPPPPPTPAPDPEPTGPATPGNLQVTGTTATSITWSWNAVEGVLGYQGQFSPDAEFTVTDPTFIIVAPATSHTVSNLEGSTTGHFRVRSGAGSSLTDLIYSDWTDGVSGTSTAAPPPPAPTALDAPGGVTAETPTRTTVRVSWDDVDDADSYTVQQSEDGGAFGAATCEETDGPDVTGTVCTASELSQATGYRFRVRANTEDEDLANSPFSSASNTATTLGSQPSAPIVGGQIRPEITWSSTASDVTWRWDPAPDDRQTHVIAVVSATERTTVQVERDQCPALGAVSEAAPTAGGGWSSDAEFALGYTHTAAAGEGTVVALCVRRTWEDDTGPQYGPASISWATTAPKIATGDAVASDGPKDDEDTMRTTSIRWSFETDYGFKYEVRTVSAQTDEAGTQMPACQDEGVGTKTLESTTDNADGNFDLTGLSAYTTYAACARAVDGENESSWTVTTSTYGTLPGMPSLTSSVATQNTATNATGTISWTFPEHASIPSAITGFNVKHFTVQAPSTAPTRALCEAGTGLTEETTPTLGGGDGQRFRFPASYDYTEAQAATHHYHLGCVRATIGSGRNGPWAGVARRVNVPAQ